MADRVEQLRYNLRPTKKSGQQPVQCTPTQPEPAPGDGDSSSTDSTKPLGKQAVSQSSSQAKPLSGDVYVPGLTQEDIKAADTLVELYSEGMYDLRWLLKRHNGSRGEMIGTLLQYRNLPAAEKKEIDDQLHRNHEQDRKIEAAMTLLELSGQTRDDSAAGLELMRLQYKAKLILDAGQEKQQREEEKRLQEGHETRTKEEKWRALIEETQKIPAATQHFFALVQFRRQHPRALAALRSSSRGDDADLEGGLKVVDEGELRGAGGQRVELGV